MAAEGLLIGASGAAVAGVAALRLAWALPRRSFMLNAIGWGAFVAAIVLAACHSGAWGIAVASLPGMAAALVLLARAAAGDAAGAGQRASKRRTSMLPEPGKPRRIGRRLVTFAIVTFGGMLLSVGLAVLARGLAANCGAAEVDANVIGLMTTPIAWTILTYALLMKARAAQLRLLAFWAVPGLIGVMMETMP